MQGENFKWRDGARQRRDEETAEQKNPAAHFHSEAHVSLTPPPRHISTQLAASHYLEGQLLLIIFLVKPEWGADESSGAELRRHRAISGSKRMFSDDPTPCCFDTVAHKEAEALGWMTKFDRTFQMIPLPFPLKVPRCAASTMRLFMSRCFRRCASLALSSRRSSWNAQVGEFVKLSVFAAFWSQFCDYTYKVRTCKLLLFLLISFILHSAFF